jgi:hypothetical protein
LKRRPVSRQKHHKDQLRIVLLKRHDPSQPARKIVLENWKIVFQKNMAVTRVAGEVDMHTDTIIGSIARQCAFLFPFSQQYVSVSMVDTISTEVLSEVVQS